FLCFLLLRIPLIRSTEYISCRFLFLRRIASTCTHFRTGHRTVLMFTAYSRRSGVGFPTRRNWLSRSCSFRS
ncbi:hypothetical protein PFISCL1PPCAC_1116, partial [Pristionchus fissidentatus]